MRRGQPSYAERACGLHPNREHPCDLCAADNTSSPDVRAAALAAARDAAANTRNRLGDQARRAVERGARP
jgi:hypothetical protein